MLLLIASITAALLVGGGLGYRLHAKQVRNDLRDLRYYRRNVLRKSGATTMVPGVNSYTIESFDGGRNWYAVEDNTLEVKQDADGSHYRDFTLKILGPVDAIYPGLLAHIEGMDRLMSYVQKHGPITLSGSDVQDQLDALNGAGFTVTAAA